MEKNVKMMRRLDRQKGKKHISHGQVELNSSTTTSPKNTLPPLKPDSIKGHDKRMQIKISIIHDQK